MLWTVLCGLVLAFASPWLLRLAPTRGGWLLALFPLALTVHFSRYLGAVAAGRPLAEATPWLPAAGISLEFYLDGLSLLFALLIAGVGTLVFIYAAGYLAGHRHLGRFYLALNLFMAAMLGLVLAGNLITLFVFWELTSLASYLLIGFEHEQEANRGAALQALLVTALGGLALLAGFLLIGEAAGSFSLAEILGRGEILRSHPHYLAILLLVLAGAFTKSAQVPFHFWLPSAMAAPTPVSAYLHSVTMVKAGIYLLFRFSPVLGGTPAWQVILVIVGGVTMLVAAAMAVVQSDFKRILAYTTISSLGTLVFLIGLDVPLALEAALVYLLGHALYKGALFLVAGAVDHATGSRDVTLLGGLFPRMPLVGTAALLAALSMAGAPPLFGFIGKELFYEVVLVSPRPAALGGVAAVGTSILMVMAAAIVLKPFFGRPAGSFRELHAPPVSLWLGPLVLAGLGLVAWVLPGLVDGPLLLPALRAIHPGAEAFHLALWHGFSPVLGYSLLTLAAGAGIYAARSAVRRAAARLAPLGALGPAAAYAQLLAGLNRLARWQTRVLQNGRLRIYLLTIVGTTIALVGFTLLTRSGVSFPSGFARLLPRDAAIAGMILAAAVLTVRSGSRLTAIVAMGGIGYGLALIYVQFGAPDLAMTQFTIETMTVVLFVLVFHRLPLFSRLADRRVWWPDGLVALGAGGIMTLLTLVALAERQGSRLSGFFAEQSLPAAHGRNLVNVILVDFRAGDTLGEIAVLALAGAGVLALLRLDRGGK